MFDALLLSLQPPVKLRVPFDDWLTYEAKHMRFIKIRFRKASFRPIKRMLMEANRLTKVTDVKITIKSDILLKSLERHLPFNYVERLLSEIKGTTFKVLPSLRACAVFFLALCKSLQTVPLETPILSPASS